MHSPSHKTLLFAEDEPELLEIYSEWFKARGYNVLGARNGRDAIVLCRSQHVDLLISDVRMAGGDGIELAKQVKSSVENNPLVVFLTGFVERFLKSPRELWTAPVNCKCDTRVEKSYLSLEFALEEGDLNIGRGGMFVRDCDALREERSVEFQFEFSDGRTKRVDGCGIVRWKRTSHHPALPSGIGIEILRLGDHALDAVTEWISNARPKAFIPRGPEPVTVL
jgi:CheY-like chemotaxis protein